MISAEKKKTIGKYIIVILCIAILFFLLLPFLEEPSATNANSASAKKATPQIFTSNPLTDLARKIYALFSGGKRAERNGGQFAFARRDSLPADELSSLPAASDTSATAATPSGEQVDTISASTDAYGQAAFVDENGEWVLIQQTAPDSSQRGLHEVNTSDSAYDKLLRLERQAKWTASPTQTAAPTIPDSKWARMWKPIQKMLGLDNKQTTPTALASAAGSTAKSAGLGSSRNTAGNSYKDFDDSWSWTPGTKNTSGASPVFNLLNPAEFLRETADNLKDTAEKMLDRQTADSVSGIVEQKRGQYLAQFNQTLMNQLAQDATGEMQNLVADTVACDGKKSSSLYSSSHSQCSVNTFNEENKQQTRAQSLSNLAKAIGASNASENLAMDMMVLLGKTTPQDSLVRPDTQDPELQKLYDFFYNSSGCKDHDCYWVGANSEFQTDPSLQTVISTAGGNYIGEGKQQTHTATDIINKYVQHVIQTEPDYDGRFDDTNPDAQQNFKNLLEALPQYMPLTKQQLSGILARNTPPAPGTTPTQRPVLVIMPDANNTKVLTDEGTLPDLTYVVYDPKGQLLDATASEVAEDGFEEAVYNDPTQRGQALNQLIINRVTQIKGQLKQAAQDMTGEVATRSVKDSAAKAAEELKKNLGNKPADFM